MSIVTQPPSCTHLDLTIVLMGRLPGISAEFATICGTKGLNENTMLAAIKKLTMWKTNVKKKWHKSPEFCCFCFVFFVELYGIPQNSHFLYELLILYAYPMKILKKMKFHGILYSIISVEEKGVKITGILFHIFCGIPVFF